MNNIVSTSLDLFQVKLQFTSEVYFIENHSNELATVLKMHPDKGIESIRRYDAGKFKRINKNIVKLLFCNNTENAEALKKKGYLR